MATKSTEKKIEKSTVKQNTKEKVEKRLKTWRGSFARDEYDFEKDGSEIILPDIFKTYCHCLGSSAEAVAESVNLIRGFTNEIKNLGEHISEIRGAEPFKVTVDSDHLQASFVTEQRKIGDEYKLVTANSVSLIPEKYEF
jgi:hypothetical protein